MEIVIDFGIFETTQRSTRCVTSDASFTCFRVANIIKSIIAGNFFHTRSFDCLIITVRVIKNKITQYNKIYDEKYEFNGPLLKIYFFQNTNYFRTFFK